MVWNLFPSKGDFSFGKNQKSQGTKSGLCVTWMIWCFAKKPFMKRGAWAGILSWWSCQSPVAHSCSLLNHLNSSHRGMFKLNAKLDADSLLFLFILNSMAKEDTCSLNGVYHPHWPVQWSRHCSHMCIPVQSPWLPGNINVVQTVLVILTMAGLFPDRSVYNLCLVILKYNLICIFTLWMSISSNKTIGQEILSVMPATET